MTDQLRQPLTRLAERAEPAPPDPTVWSRARRSRRRTDLVAASAVGAAVLAVVVTIGVVAGPDPDRPEPAPAEQEGIPAVVRGVDGTGGLPLETDLAVGDASVAIANPRGAFVVTADDGVYHRLDLPGFDPQVYDDPEVRRTGMVGLRLSPDGTRLAYGWHAALPEETGQQHGMVRSGVRIVDLGTGRVEGVPEDRVPPAEFGAAIDNQGFPWGRVPYGLRWSADGRYLAYEQVWTAAPADGVTVEHWGQGLDEAYRYSEWASGAAVYDTATGTRRDVYERRWFDRDFWLSFEWAGWPPAVADDGSLASDVDELVPADHTVGVFDGSRRLLLETRTPSSHLLAVDLRSGAREPLELPLSPVHVDLLGWVGRDHALAQVRQGSAQHLIVLDLSDADVETDLAAPFDDEGTESTFSFATDFASVAHPTVDFSAAENSEGSTTGADAPLPAAEDARPDGTWWLLALAAGIVAAGVTALARRRRIRV